MKKVFKKVLAIAISIVSLVVYTACGRFSVQDTETEHKDETIIKVFNYDCGYGREYVVNTAKRFMEASKDISYEEGKKGVYIDIVHTKNNATGTYLVSGLSNNDADVYFTESTTPAMLKSSGLVMNIADWCNATSQTAGASRYADSTSIASRMYDDYKDFYISSNNSTDEIYAVPLFVSGNIITYDVDLCNEKGLWIQEGSTETELILSRNRKEGVSLGVDGVYGTSDDGLPLTWTQMYAWFDAACSKGLYALHFMGAHPQSIDASIFNFFADFEGAEKFKINYTFDGYVDNLVDTVDDNGNVTYLPGMQITQENAYYLQKQEGRYRATEILKKIAEKSSTWVNPVAFSPSETHTESQSTYVASKYSTSSKRMLCFAHGAYWESEARAVFESYESQSGGRLDRHFAPLPQPKYDIKDTGVGSTTTIMSTSLSSMFVKTGAKGGKLDAIKDFVTFFNSQEQMSHQLPEATVSRPFNYDILESDKGDISYYQEKLYEFFHSDRVNVVFASDKNDLLLANIDDFHTAYWMFESKPSTTSDTTTYTGVWYFRDNPTVKARDYFYGYFNKYDVNNQAKWKAMLNRIG